MKWSSTKVNLIHLDIATISHVIKGNNSEYSCIQTVVNNETRINLI